MKKENLRLHIYKYDSCRREELIPKSTSHSQKPQILELIFKCNFDENLTFVAPSSFFRFPALPQHVPCRSIIS